MRGFWKRLRCLLRQTAKATIDIGGNKLVFSRQLFEMLWEGDCIGQHVTMVSIPRRGTYAFMLTPRNESNVMDGYTVKMNPDHTAGFILRDVGALKLLNDLGYDIEKYEKRSGSQTVVVRKRHKKWGNGYYYELQRAER